MLCSRILFLIVSFSVASLLAQTSEFQVEVSSTMRKSEHGDFYFAKVDLGRLTSGESGAVSIVLKNPYEEPVEFSDASLNCNCIKFSSNSNRIDASGQVVISLRLTTPRMHKQPNMTSFVTLNRADGKRGPMVRLKMEYELGGLLTIPGKLVVTEIPMGASAGEIRVPFVYTDPVKIENLEVKTSKSLQELNFEFVEDKDGKAFLVAAVIDEFLENGSVSGEVGILDRESNRKDGFFCTIKKTEKYKISPTVFRFRSINEGERSSDEEPVNVEAEKFEAVAILRVNRTFEEHFESDAKDASSSEEEKEISVTGSIDNYVVGIRKERLAKDCYKLLLELDKSKLENETIDDKPIVLTIIDNGKSESFSQRFIFLN